MIDCVVEADHSIITVKIAGKELVARVGAQAATLRRMRLQCWALLIWLAPR